MPSRLDLKPSQGKRASLRTPLADSLWPRRRRAEDCPPYVAVQGCERTSAVLGLPRTSGRFASFFFLTCAHISCSTSVAAKATKLGQPDRSGEMCRRMNDTSRTEKKNININGLRRWIPPAPRKEQQNEDSKQVFSLTRPGGRRRVAGAWHEPGIRAVSATQPRWIPTRHGPPHRPEVERVGHGFCAGWTFLRGQYRHRRGHVL